MKLWKVLSGAAIGVGAVAAVPFTGGGSLIGAVTLAASLSGTSTVVAAVGAGGVGAVIGACMDGEKKARAQGYREGKQEAKAENLTEIIKLKNKLDAALTKINESSRYFKTVYAMAAVAVAAANCDGGICSDKREQIEMFINGVSEKSLPESVKNKINSLYENPVNIKEAFKMAKDSNIDIGVFDEIFNVVISIDGAISKEEEAFIQAWNNLKAA